MLAVLLALAPGAARADSTVNVNTTSDAPVAGQCSLREAVAYADGSSEPGCASGTASGTTTINLPAGTYTLSGSVLSLTADATIDGAGAASTTISGGNAVRVLSVATGVDATLNGVTITAGVSGNSSQGCTTTGTGIFTTTTCPLEPGLDGGGIANAGTLTLSNSAVTGNSASAGALPFTRGNLVISCLVTLCPPTPGQSAGSGGNGGGIDNTGRLTIDHSTISHNSAGAGGSGTDGFSGGLGNPGVGQPGGSGSFGGSGGGLYNESGATATIVDSTIASNQAGAGGNAGSGSNSAVNPGAGGSAGFPGEGGFGGGIYNLGTLTIIGSTLSANSTGKGGNGGSGGIGMDDPNGSSTPSAGGGWGGAVFTATSATVALTDDTFTGNAASSGGTGGAGAGSAGQGGAVAQDGLGLVQLQFDTIAGNVAAGTAGGLDNASLGSVTEAATIVASNTGTPAKNCTTGNIIDDGHNLVFGDNSCPGTAANPLLGPLADNGGPTETMALQPGSAALDAVPANACPVATDQRGVARPQPGQSSCDAGAYEHALPVISGVGATATPTTATVTAQINPELSSANTSVVVDYGTTAAYGSTVSQTIPRGAAAVPFSASLSGLQPNTVYHYRIVATNGELIAGASGVPGQTATGDATFTTQPPPPVTPKLAAAIRSASVSGTKAKLVISCSGGGAGATCSGPVTLTAHATMQGKTILAVAASKQAAKASKGSKKKKKKKKVTKLIRVASGSYAMASGQSQTVTLSLNGAGRKLLADFYKLPATVNLSGSATGTHVKFAYPKIKAIVLYTARFNGRGLDTIGAILVRSAPKGASVRVQCVTGNCSPRSGTFVVKKGSRLSLGRFAVRLKPKATVAFEVTHAGQVGHVLELADDSSGGPKQSILCLPPGVRKPTKCAA